MDTIEFIRHMFAASHRQVEAAMKDMTAGQFNWVPTGTANPISATYIHSLSSEDFFVQALLQGKPRLWEENGCAEKTGIMKTPGYSGGWEEFKHMQVDLALFLDYQQAVWAGTDAYLEKLDPGGAGSQSEVCRWRAQRGRYADSIRQSHPGSRR